MNTLRRNKQKMKYSVENENVTVYERDSYGNIKYIIMSDGTKIPKKKTVIRFSEPTEFLAGITNKLSESLIKEYGIDDSTQYAQIVAKKGYLPLCVGAVIWKKSEVTYINGYVDEKSADYVVKGVADEGINFDLFLLQRNVK